MLKIKHVFDGIRKFLNYGHASESHLQLRNVLTLLCVNVAGRGEISTATVAQENVISVKTEIKMITPFGVCTNGGDVHFLPLSVVSDKKPHCH